MSYKLEIKNLKVFKENSQETTCMHADLHVNGELAAHVRNDGGGGMTCYDFTDPKLRDELMQVAKDMPPKKIPDMGYGEFEVPFALDVWIDDLVLEAELQPDIDRHAHVRYKDQDYQVGGSHKFNVPPSPALLSMLDERGCEYTIITTVAELLTPQVAG